MRAPSREERRWERDNAQSKRQATDGCFWNFSQRVRGDVLDWRIWVNGVQLTHQRLNKCVKIYKVYFKVCLYVDTELYSSLSWVHGVIRQHSLQAPNMPQIPPVGSATPNQHSLVLFILLFLASGSIFFEIIWHQCKCMKEGMNEKSEWQLVQYVFQV